MKKVWKIILVILTVINYGCDNDNGLGSSIFPAADSPALIVTDTVTVEMYTVKETEKLFSGSQNDLLLGVTNDKVFGMTRAGFLAKFSNTSYGSFRQYTECDSMVLTLGFKSKDKFYGDTMRRMKLNVYKVNKFISYDSVYYWSESPEKYTNYVKVGETEFVPGIADSMITVVLDKKYGNEIVKACNDSAYTDRIFGLYFEIDRSCKEGCIMKINYNNDFTEYKIFCHKGNDSTNVTFSIAQTDGRITFFEHDYSTGKIEKQLNKPLSEKDSLLYLQAMGGTKICVRFPYIGDFNKVEGKYFIINRAQLDLPLGDSLLNLENLYSPISSYLFLGEYFETKDDKVSIKYFDECISTATQSGTSIISMIPSSYYSSTHKYTLNMTERVKDLIKTYGRGSTPAYDIYIYPYNRTSDFRRTVLCSPTHKHKPAKLIVEYSVYEK